MTKIAKVPLANRYAELLKIHIRNQRGDNFRPFDGILTIPRQLEIHLSNESRTPCNMLCIHCQGQNLQKVIEPFDDIIFPLVEKLDGKIPLFVVSGAYAEPTLNIRLIELIKLIKRTGSSFGLHTNATLLTKLEEKNRFITRLYNVSTPDDYMTIALDAGSRKSFAKTKRVDGKHFDSVIAALQILHSLNKREQRPSLKARITYLLNEFNSSPEELQNVVRLMRQVEVDSLRFAIPYAPYGTPLEECWRYKNEYEVPFYRRIWNRIAPLLSEDASEKPQIFAMSPEAQDVEKITFSHCFYGYYMINLGADGFFYRCSAVAHPGFKGHRLGKATDNLENFYAMVLKNQDINFNPLKQCLPIGARCNRASIDINTTFEAEFFSKTKEG